MPTVVEMKKLASRAARGIMGDRRERAGMYKRELLKGRAYWGPDGTWREQLAFYMANKHQMLGVCLAHPRHPLSRRERGVLLFITQCFQFASTALLSPTFGSEEDSFVVTLSGLYVSLLMVLVQLVLNCLVTADDRLCGSRQGGALRCFAKCCGRSLLCIMVLVALVFVMMGLGVATTRGDGVPLEAIVGAYASSLAQSLTYVFLLSSLLSFSIRFRCEKAKAEAMDAAHAASAAAAAKAMEEAKAMAEAGEAAPASPPPAHAVAGGSGFLARVGSASRTAIATTNPMLQRVPRVIKVTPPFAFSFQELLRWGEGEDLDAATMQGRAEEGGEAEGAAALAPAVL